jgi:hypothetical protein
LCDRDSFPICRHRSDGTDTEAECVEFKIHAQALCPGVIWGGATKGGYSSYSVKREIRIEIAFIIATNKLERSFLPSLAVVEINSSSLVISLTD